MGKQKHSKIIIVFILIAILLTTVIIIATSNHYNEREKHKISYNEFIEQIKNKEIEQVEYSKSVPDITGITKDNMFFVTDNPQTDEFKQFLLENDIKVVTAKAGTVTAISKAILQLALYAAFICIVFIMINKVFIRNQLGTTKNNWVTRKTHIVFSDVAGNKEAKENMMELVDFLKNPDKYSHYGVTTPKGTILYGLPGTGKTLLAKALAGTANVPFISVSGSDFVEKFVGVGAERIRSLFKEAREKAPCIVFIDEIDAVGKKREGISNGATDERNQTLNQLLVEIDGFTGNEGVIVIAATNRLDTLDEALLRSGRFDRQIHVELPDVDARYEILKIHSKNKPLNTKVDLREIAKLTLYMSGADLENVMNEAGIYAAKYEHKDITMEDIDRAINKVLVGEEKKDRKNISTRDREITAFHEAGHALIAKRLTGKNIPKVTIIPTTKGAGGYTLITPEEERMFETKKDMLNDIAIALGGRISEELVFGEDYITNGASQDLKVVTRIAIKMVKNYGMSENIGLLNVNELYGNNYISTNNETITREVKKIINETYKETKRLLSENESALFDLAQTLLEKETIYENELDNIIREAKPTESSNEKIADNIG
ncbi:MAG: ATP-dependent zinc metalloprotease FtsH [Candidatus Pacebacteria bacterium]|nr:ATP-dependent zinc metalloprotease FtsH [Candidatus Paceibacterota bacterium]